MSCDLLETIFEFVQSLRLFGLRLSLSLGEILFQSSKLFFLLEVLSSLLLIDFKNLNVWIDLIHFLTKLGDFSVDQILLLRKIGNFFILESVVDLGVLQMILVTLADR